MDSNKQTIKQTMINELITAIASAEVEKQCSRINRGEEHSIPTAERNTVFILLRKEKIQLIFPIRIGDRRLSANTMNLKLIAFLFFSFFCSPKSTEKKLEDYEKSALK